MLCWEQIFPSESDLEDTSSSKKANRKSQKLLPFIMMVITSGIIPIHINVGIKGVTVLHWTMIVQM